MAAIDRHTATIRLGLALGVLIVWRFLAALDAKLNLSVDEAQYFLWSLEPDWGYFSKPPMIAWIIAFSTRLCGDSEICIRLPALLLFAASAGIIALLAQRLFDARTAFWAGLAFATLLLSSFYSWVMTTDSILLFLWSFALLLFARALDTDRWRDWLAVGVIVGLGLLTKYSMGLFLGCAFLVLLIDHRERLASAKPWLAGLLALSFLVPNILWNMGHQFATLRHTAEISQLDRDGIHPASLLSFGLAQFGVMGPLLLPALLLAAIDRQTWRGRPQLRMLALFSLPVLCFFLLLALLSRSHANWAAPAYVAATILAVAMLLRRNYTRWLIWAIATNLLLAATLYHWHRLAPAIGIALKKQTDPFHSLRGWDQAGKQLGQWMHATGCRAVIAADRGQIVELAYYARRELGTPVAALSYNPYNPSGRIRNHFELTADIAHRQFDCGILVGEFSEERLQREFTHLNPLPGLSIPSRNKPETVSAWQVAGFNGYGSAR